MQPPIEPPATRRALHGDEEELYRRHDRNLQRAVAHAVNAPRELIEDACQTAWIALLRSQPDRRTIFSWLYVVAIHEAYRLSALERRQTHLEELGPDRCPAAVIADGFNIDDAIEAREALTILAELPARQRTDLALHVAGYSYREIAERTGGRTYTNVNKHLTRARARARLARLGIPSPRCAEDRGAKSGSTGSS